MYNPVSTYRVQLHRHFTFKDLKATIPYLVKLGIKTIYASPVFTAVTGSQHGYDAVSFENINSEIGTEEELLSIHEQLKENGIGWIQDIVPNHMAFHPQNGYLMDVLEHGKQSPYFHLFDFFNDILTEEKLMVPFLGSAFDEALYKGEIAFKIKKDKIFINYAEQLYPICPSSYSYLLTHENTPGSLLELINNISFVSNDNWTALRVQIFEPFRQHIEERIAVANKNPEFIKTVLALQHYRLCYWRETEQNINYRRFFTINGLIGLRMEDENVFNLYHKKILAFVSQGIFQGLRIDHVDGLYDPTEYLKRLRHSVGPDVYISVEKILDKDEEISQNWPVQGSTGYDFLANANKALTYSNSESRFNKLYNKYTDKSHSFSDIIYQCKSHILYKHMCGELDNLYNLFCKLQLAPLHITKESSVQLKKAIGEVLINCPVYRYYNTYASISSETLNYLSNVCDKVCDKHPDLKPAIQLLRNVFTGASDTNADTHQNALSFFKRCMQFSGPLMAKGNEDTLMYIYNRFIAHNEVGDTAETFYLQAKSFHQKMIERALNSPLAQNATSTHDTKRGEDTRARLNVLSEIYEDWYYLVKVWDKLTEDIKIDTNDKYHIFQMLVGTYPIQGRDLENYSERLEEYAVKALREGKQHSNWAEPNEQYEASVRELIKLLLDKDTNAWREFNKIQQLIEEYGIVNSLTQVVLKLTCPGVPDIYQGTELWDLSMVDPDNRRHVDYDIRSNMLNDLKENIAQLWEERATGKIKLWLIQKLLFQISYKTEVFNRGIYYPLKVKGKYKNHVLAYARFYKTDWYIISVPLNTAILSKKQHKDVANLDWGDTSVILPDSIPLGYTDVLRCTGHQHNGKIHVGDLFKSIPLSILHFEHKNNERGAGILLSVTSLPSKFGIGNIGSASKKFIDFLFAGKQKIWQMLPLNPIDSGNKYSPYSSVSSMAGNILLIDPEYLVQRGLLTKQDIEKFQLPEEDNINYTVVERNMSELLSLAYKRHNTLGLENKFYQFCEKEAYWLSDFAIFTLLSEQYNTTWNEWPEEYKYRKPNELENFSKTNAYKLNFVKWTQYLFFKQWQQLKRYCAAFNVKLLGDLPFYVSYHSAEVWARPDLFCLDENLEIKGIAGVPPDYFSDEGQLWGMPTFNWNNLKKENYEWWIKRLKKNLDMYDLLRLDHFRAFAAYWQVQACHSTAKNGEWIKGPGKDFFDTIKRELGDLPFVAEDLGYEMDDVYALREEIGLPGMKVLQFAFGDNMPESVDIPHNYRTNTICYTGTHDNNTAIGWYNHETKKEDRKRVEQYTQLRASDKNIHLILSRLAYASVSKMAILPMQDVLGLDESARMNTPGTSNGNWLWRVTSKQLNSKIFKSLSELTDIYNRS